MPSVPPADEHVGAIPAPGSKKYTLLGADRRPYPSETPGLSRGRERRVAPQKLPEMLQVVDALPTTMTGKVQKFLLREAARALADQQS